jgi:hypothetical protein
MSVARVVEISSTSPESFEDAIVQGIDRAIDAQRSGETVRLGSRVDLPQCRAGVHERPPAVRFDEHVGHAREIQHDAVVAQRAPRDIVTAAANRQFQTSFPREADDRRNIGGMRTANDQRGPAIDHRVPDNAWCEEP